MDAALEIMARIVIMFNHTDILLSISYVIFVY
jgi:hypothetical protein